MADPYSDIPGFVSATPDITDIPGFIPAEQPSQSMWDSTVTWPNAVRMAGSSAGDYLGTALAPATGGLSYPILSFGLGAASEGVARAMEGQPFNPYVMATEGAFNLLPGPNIPGKGAGVGELAKFGAKSAGYGAAQGLAGAYPRYVAETGDWGGPSAAEYAAQTGMGGVVGGATGLGLAGVHRVLGHSASAPPPITPPTTDPNLLTPVGSSSTVPPPTVPPDTGPARTSTTPLVEGVLPMTVSLRQATASDVALWQSQGYVYVPGGMKGSDGFEMMVRGDIAPVYVRLRQQQQEVQPPAPPPEPVNRPEIPSAMGANQTPANNTVVIPTAKANNPAFLANMDAGGYKIVENRPDGMSIFQKFFSDEGGWVDYPTMWANLKRMFGRDPTPDEVERGMARQPVEGETRGRVAPFEQSSNIPPPPRQSLEDVQIPGATGEYEVVRTTQGYAVIDKGNGQEIATYDTPEGAEAFISQYSEYAPPLSPEEEAALIEAGHLRPFPTPEEQLGNQIPWEGPDVTAGSDSWIRPEQFPGPRNTWPTDTPIPPQMGQQELPLGPFGETGTRGLPDDVNFLMRQMANPSTPEEGPLPTQSDLPDTISRTGIGERPETIVKPEIKGGVDERGPEYYDHPDKIGEITDSDLAYRVNEYWHDRSMEAYRRGDTADSDIYSTLADLAGERHSYLVDNNVPTQNELNESRRGRNLEDLADQLYEALDSKGAIPSPSIVLDILRHINGAKNTGEALRNLTDIRAYVDSATTPIQKSIFEDIYQRAFAKYHETLPKSTADTTAPKFENRVEDEFERDFNRSFRNYERESGRAYNEGQLDLPMGESKIQKWDVHDTGNGKILRTFDSKAAAEEFIAKHPDGNRLDYSPHDPSWGNADEVIPEFKAPTEKQLPLKLGSEAYWKKRDLGINKSDMNQLVSEMKQNRLLSHLSWEWARSDFRTLRQDGPPGLSVEGDDIIYRGPNGEPVAHIQLIGTQHGAPEVASFAADRTKGLLYGRATFAVAKKAFEMNAFKMGSYSKHTKKFIDGLRNFIDDDKGTVDFAAFGPAWDRIKMAALRLRKDASENLRVGEVWDQIKKFAADETGAIPAKDATPGAMWRNLKEQMGWGQGASEAGKQKKDETNWIKEALAVPSGSTTMLDASAPGRQGLALIHTKEFWKAGAAMFKGFTPAGFRQIDDQLRSKPIFQEKIDMETGKVIPSFAKQIGMKLFSPASEAPMGKRAQGTASRWLEMGIGKTVTDSHGRKTWESTPGSRAWENSIGVPIRATNRMFITFLNHLNANRTEFLLNKARDISIQALDTGSARPGIFKQNFTKQEAMDLNPYQNIVRAKEIADFVNTATGHGPLKTHLLPYKGAEVSMEKAADVLNAAMFSPGLFMSRVRMLNPNTYVMASPFVRKQYMKSAIAMAAAWYGFTELAKQAGGDEVQVSNDWTSADFGKVRIGNTRMDPGGGFLQFLVQYGRMYKGGSTSSATGQFRKFGEGFQAETQLSNAQRFMSNKLNPVAKFAYDLAAQSQYNPFHVGDRTLQLFVPLVIQDINELAKEDPSLLPWIVPIALGMGTQTYSKGESVGKFIPPENDWLAGGGGVEDLMINQDYR